MRRMHCIPLSLSVFALILSPICAHADTLQLGLSETTVANRVGANTTMSQDVQVSANTAIDGFAFYMSDPTGAPVTYSITDLTTASTLFTQTFDDTTWDPTLTNIAIPESSKEGWLELYLSPITLNAGSDIYAFSISGAGALEVGGDPTFFTERSLETSGSPELGLRVWGSSAVAPEPNTLILLGSGASIMAFAGMMRRRRLQ